MGKSMKCIIISGGYIDDVFALEWLEKNAYDLLIAADSGMNFLYRNEIMPDVIAGDFDSVDDAAYAHFMDPSVQAAGQGVLKSSDTKSRRPEILRLNPIKDDTDTEFVIREAIRRGAGFITILGGTGTRLDHVLGNVHLLGIGLQCGVDIELVDVHNRIRMITGETLLDKQEQFGQFVSLLPFGGDAKGVTLEGFKYPLKDYTIESFSSIGISNEIVGEKARIRIEDGILLLIESRE